MKNSMKNHLSFFSFCALIIVALLILVNNLLPALGIELGGFIFNLLNTVQYVLTLIVLGSLAYNYVAEKSKGYRVVFWIAVAIFVLSAVLPWIFQ